MILEIQTNHEVIVVALVSMILVPFLLSWCCLISVVIKASTTGTLLDDSEYQNLLAFDEMLSTLLGNLHNQTESILKPTKGGKKTPEYSLTLNYANVAMMYHQRNQRWKQGGNVESLQFINLALDAQQSAIDHAHTDHKLRRSMMLHKAVMLTSLGLRTSALTVLDDLTNMHNTTSSASPAQTPTLFDYVFRSKVKETLPMSDQELSSVLYHKAELLLTLYDDFAASVVLFRQALALHPCHHLAHMQLMHAMKATGSATRDEWLAVIVGMEQYLLNIKQRPVNAKFKYKFKPPHIEYQVPVDNTYTTSAIGGDSNDKDNGASGTAVLSDMYTAVFNRVYYAYHTLHSAVYPTTTVCTFTSDGDSDLYASTGSMRTTITLSGIYASVGWALFVAADAVQMTGDDEEDTHTRNVAWKYLQQARHFERQRSNEQHAFLQHQRRLAEEQGEDLLPEGVHVDNVYTSGDIGSGGAGGESSGSGYTLEEQAVRQATEHSAKQAQHLVKFFQKGYWGNAEHYLNYTSGSATATKNPADEAGSKTRIPIFIVGFFRSGSTLLESLLEAHSGSVYSSTSTDSGSSEDSIQAAELGFTRKAVWGMGEDSPFVFEMYSMQEQTMRAYDTLEQQKSLLQEKYKSPNSKNRQKAENRLESEFMREYSDIIDSKAKVIVGKMIQKHRDLHSGSNETTTPRHIVDKMLSNYVNIGLIHLVFPRAIVLHPVRDPLDTLLSCYSTRFGDPSAAYTLHTDTLVQRYVQYLQVMQHFRSVLPHYTLPAWHITTNNSIPDTADPTDPNETSTSPKASTSSRRRRIQALVDVRYEELVARPERVLRYVLQEVLGVEYVPHSDRRGGADSRSDDTTDSVVTDVTGTSTTTIAPVRVVHTASRLQVKQPTYTSSVGRWRKYPQLLHSLVPVLLQHLPYLASIRALPYLDPNSTVLQSMQQDSKSASYYSKQASKCKNLYTKSGEKKRDCVYMNWDLNTQFNYTQMLFDLVQ